MTFDKWFEKQLWAECLNEQRENLKITWDAAQTEHQKEIAEWDECVNQRYERDTAHMNEIALLKKDCVAWKKSLKPLSDELKLLRAVHYYARGVMRHNGVDEERTVEAYKAMACAVHCVNDFDNNCDDEEG